MMKTQIKKIYKENSNKEDSDDENENEEYPDDEI